MRKLTSGRFWLKCGIVAGIFFTLALILQAVMMAVFDAPGIAKRLNAAVAEGGYAVAIDPDVSRSTFPSPNFTVHGLKLTRNGAPVLVSDSANFRFSWWLLLGRIRVKRLELDGARLTLQRDEQGKWNAPKAWQGASDINRILLKDSLVLIQDARTGQTPELSHVSGEITGLADAGGVYRISADTRTSAGDWRMIAQGAWSKNGQLVRAQDNTVTLSGSLKGLGDTDIVIKGNARYEDGVGALERVQGEWRAADLGLRLNFTSSPWRYAQGVLTVPRLDGNGGWKSAEAQYEATLGATALTWGASGISVDEMRVQMRQSDAQGQSSLTLRAHVDSAFAAKSGPNLTLSGMRLQTRRTPFSGRPVRWQTDMEGLASFVWRDQWGWPAQGQMSLSGSFDNQPASVQARLDNADARAPRWQIDAKASQVDLTPYQNDAPQDASNSSAASEAKPSADTLPLPPLLGWLGRLDEGRIEGNVHIDQLLSERLRLTEIDTHYLGTRYRFTLDPFKAKAYGGTLSGSLSVFNDAVPAFTLEGKLANVDVQALGAGVFQNPGLSGLGGAEIKLSTQGSTNEQRLRALTGSAQFAIQNGSINGIDVGRMAQNASAASAPDLPEILALDKELRTPFRSLTLQSQWLNGQVGVSNIVLSGPNLQATGAGSTDLVTLKQDYTLHVQTSARARGVVLPLRITGTLTQPRFALDYHAITLGLTNSNQKQEALQNALENQWQWIKPQLGASAPAASAPN